mgnify:FL=1
MVLCDNPELYKYFQEVSCCFGNYQMIANWICNVFVNHEGSDKIPPQKFAKMLDLIEKGKLSNNIARENVFPGLCRNTEKKIQQIIEEQNVSAFSEERKLINIIKQIIDEHAEETRKYTNGKKQLLGFFIGQVMKKTKRKADPKKVSKLLKKELEKKIRNLPGNNI